jgi:predicted RNA methylase
LGAEGLLGDSVSGIHKNELPHNNQQFMDQVSERIERGVHDNKITMEKLAASLKIFDKTEVKELIELVIVNTARTIAQRKDLSIEERYKQIVRLYENQVNLSHRTSQSILLQQYSTPAPIGFLAGMFCGVENFTIENGKMGFEPSAGNGLLTIAAIPSTFIVNEIDRTRNLHLQTQGYKKVYQVDATNAFSKTIGTGFNKSFDAVITNPPFGRADTKIEFDGYPISTLEHVMTIRALNTLKDDGRAAIIIGGHTRYDDKKRVQKGAQRIFLNYLYHHYNVADIIPINGAKLYSRQGTSFDTRLILIAGRKEKPSGFAPVYDSYRDTEVKRFDELFDRVMEAKKFSSFEYADMENEKEEIPVIPRDEKMKAKWNHIQKAYTMFWNAYMTMKLGSLILVESDGYFYSFGNSAFTIGHKANIETLPINIVGDESVFIKIPADELDFCLEHLSHSGEEVYLKRTTKSFRGSMEEEMALIERELQKEIDRLKNGEDLGAPYMPASEACVVLNTVVPDSMEYETKKALELIQSEVGGNIDEFVRQRLGYASKIELCKSLSAEQTDAVAMAIYNIEARNQGMIIGDQTGIGKGRIAAAMIRYAVLQGFKPVFITEKPNLFSDIYRDLSAIGSANLVPFIVNGRESKTDIKDENGEIIHQALPSVEQQVYFKDQRIPAFCDFVLATYTQFNSPDKKPEKPSFLRTIAQDNILILDESHNASGSSQTGEFLQKVVEHAKGLVFLSATFAKRPDNMPIYAMKTAISDANMTKEDLVNAISKGGVALQEVLASQLVKEGQMLRRERSFEGVEVNYLSLDDLETEHKAIADNITEILREIIAFQTTSVDTLVNELDEIAVAEGKEVNLREGTSQAGVDNLPYFSKVFQVINQMLFSIKAEAVADRAILRLKEGKKPVIAFASTMGSFIEQMENEQAYLFQMEIPLMRIFQKS